MRLISVLFVALVTAACGSAGPGPAPCDPLAGPESTIALATLIGAGRHPDGTTYLLDKAGSVHRVFVGSGPELRRKRVTVGVESAGPSGTFVMVSVTEAEPPFRLKVEMMGGTSRMGVLRETSSMPDFVIGQQGDVLAPLTVAEVQALQLHNLGAFVEYDAQIPDGRRLVVTRPEDEWDYEDFRLFLGPPERLEERKVTSVQRARDGGTTKISFQFEGAPAEAFIPAPQNVNEPATLKHGGQTFTMVVSQGTAPAGLQFLCW
jgi:hypothetical protein